MQAGAGGCRQVRIWEQGGCRQVNTWEQGRCRRVQGRCRRVQAGGPAAASERPLVWLEGELSPGSAGGGTRLPCLPLAPVSSYLGLGAILQLLVLPGFEPHHLAAGGLW